MYKVLHKESGLYWKGSGMNKNNKSFSFIFVKNKTGQQESVKMDKSSEEHALQVCFSKTGKTWTTLRAVKCALGYRHEEGLNKLLEKCELIEIKEVIVTQTPIIKKSNENK